MAAISSIDAHAHGLRPSNSRAVESSWTENAEYAWENCLALGAGVTLAPDFRQAALIRWLEQFIVFVEYVTEMVLALCC
jgi:hypothetical protein